MADIDKALPNSSPKKEFEIPGEEDLKEQAEEQIEIEQAEGDPVDVTENEDGSVDINLDPATASPEGGDEHYSNLAEFLPDDILGEIASDLNGKYMDYSSSRKDWEKAYITGLDLLDLNTTIEQNLFKEHQVQLILYLLKRLHNFKH